MEKEKIKITITPSGQVKREVIVEDLAAPLRKPSLVKRFFAMFSTRGTSEGEGS